MKAVLIISILLFPQFAIAIDYPVYYERVKSKSYSLIILYDSNRATYLLRSTHDDGATWFFYEENAVWGYYPKIEGKSVIPSLLIKTSRFRFDFFEEKSNLVEIDKMGPQGMYVQVKNVSE